MESALCGGGDDPDLRLIETLRWDGTGPVRPEAHLARLARGAIALGWPCDMDRARAALAQDRGTAPARMRLTLDHDGTIHVAAAALPRASRLWRVGIAAERLVSSDPWLRIKSSRRPAYDAARAALGQALDEAILLNERDEVCDGTITTVFFDRGAGLRTPPLQCGLLPGILRAERLAAGCREEILPAADLRSVRLWMGNALRGLIPATLAD